MHLLLRAWISTLLVKRVRTRIFKHGLINGGPIFIVFGWLIASFFTFIVGISFKKLYLWLKFALYSLSRVPFTFGKKTYLKIKNISYF